MIVIRVLKPIFFFFFFFLIGLKMFEQNCSIMCMEKIFNALNLSQRLDLRSLNKHVALQKLSIYNT